MKQYCIAGNSGHGKSFFLKKVYENVEVTHGNNPDGSSVTKEIQKISGKSVVFSNCICYDTPGIPDTDSRNNKVILDSIVTEFLKSDNNSLDGIILLHNVTVQRHFKDYQTIFSTISSQFNISKNVLIIFTFSNSSRDEENIENKSTQEKMCANNGISNFMFWDSKYPLANQENELKQKLAKLTPIKLDKVEEFNKLIEAEQILLQKQNRRVERIPEAIYYQTNEPHDVYKDEEHYWESTTEVAKRRQGWEAKYHEDLQYMDFRSLGANWVKRWKTRSYNHKCIDHTNIDVKWNSDGLTGNFVRGMKVHMDNFLSDTKFGRANFQVEVWYNKRVKHTEYRSVTKSQTIYKDVLKEEPLSKFYKEARENALRKILNN